MNNFNAFFTIAKKEYTDALKNILFVTLFIFILFLVGVSLLVAAFHFQTEVASYNRALAQIKQMGQAGVVLSKPEYYPLQMLRGTIEYLEIIGALTAIVLGYITIAKEKGNNTLNLLLSRPVSTGTIVIGKLLGNSMLILNLLALIFLFIFLSITGIGHVFLSASEIIKLILALTFSYLYLMFFFSLSFILSVVFKNVSHGLVIGFVIWLLIVLIIPQIGDTMDPDNAVPGGLFASMHMTKLQQDKVMAKYQTYESLRNGLEESSIEKHYERLTFATLGIKDIYNGKSLSVIFKDQRYNLNWVLGFFLAGTIATFLAFTRKRIFGKE